MTSLDALIDKYVSDPGEGLPEPYCWLGKSGQTMTETLTISVPSGLKDAIQAAADGPPKVSKSFWVRLAIIDRLDGMKERTDDDEG